MHMPDLLKISCKELTQIYKYCCISFGSRLELVQGIKNKVIILLLAIYKWHFPEGAI